MLETEKRLNMESKQLKKKSGDDADWAVFTDYSYDSLIDNNRDTDWFPSYNIW